MMNKVSIIATVLLILMPTLALPQTDEAAEGPQGTLRLTASEQPFGDKIVVAQAIPKFDTEWAEEYKRLLDTFMAECSPNKLSLRPSSAGTRAGVDEIACDNLRRVIETETEKRVVLSQYVVAVFHRQGLASNIMLGLVIFVVASGIALTTFQLWFAAAKGGTQGNTELEASAKAVRITSSSVGIIILAMSLIFLYLYIQEIYKITEIPVL